MSRDPNFVDETLPKPPPNAIINRAFDGETVDLTARPLFECVLRNCTLIYDGAVPWLYGCDFHDCRVVFTGAAGRTLQFIRQWVSLHDGEPVETLARLVLGATPAEEDGER